MAALVFGLGLLEPVLNQSEVVLHFQQVLFLFVHSVVLAMAEFLLELGYLELQLFDFIALQVDELEHLEVLFLVFAENAQQLIEVVNLSCRLDLCEVLSKLLYLFHLLGALLGLFDKLVLCVLHLVML